MIEVIVISLLTLMLFAYFRNRQANRNDNRRERLQQKQEDLLEMLQKNKQNDQSVKETDNEN